MKILLVINQFYAKTNGLSISTQRFYDEFKKLGAEVRVLSGTVYGESDYSLGNYKFPIFEPIIEKQGYAFAKCDIETIEEAIEWADIVHLEEPFYIQHKAAKIARKKGKVITGTFHLYPENMLSSVHMGQVGFINYLMMKYFKSSVYKYCSFIQCPTQNVYNRLEKCKYKADKAVITNGITPEWFVERSKKPEELKDKFVVLSVGRYSIEKNQKTLLKAVSLSKYKDKIVVILAGQGPLKSKYEKLSRKYNVNAELRFMKKEELLKVGSYSDLVVHCANVEVEGMSLMEAFSCGAVPLIACAKYSASSQYGLTEHNKFKGKNYIECSQKIDWYIEHEEELKKDSRKYQEYAKDLSIENSAKKVYEEFEKILKK